MSRFREELWRGEAGVSLGKRLRGNFFGRASCWGGPFVGLSSIEYLLLFIKFPEFNKEEKREKEKDTFGGGLGETTGKENLLSFELKIVNI